MIVRRAFLAFAGGSLLTLADLSDAQTASKVFHIGVLRPTGPSETEGIFNQAMREQGFVEGQNIVIDRRYGEGYPERLAALARALVRSDVDAIVAVASAAVLAAIGATKAIPILMFGNFDPVAYGFVKSLARPEGNVTGITFAPDGTLAGKKLQLLREMVPGATRVALLAPDDPDERSQIREVQKAATSLGIGLQVVVVHGGDYEKAFAEIAAERAQVLFVAASTYFARDRRPIIEQAARYRLPAIYEWREHVVEGGLMTYSTSLLTMYKRTAFYLDRISKGARPADLPVEQPTKFELVINLKTARALGMTIPQALLLRADEIIE